MSDLGKGGDTYSEHIRNQKFEKYILSYLLSQKAQLTNFSYIVMSECYSVDSFPLISIELEIQYYNKFKKSVVDTLYIRESSSTYKALEIGELNKSVDLVITDSKGNSSLFTPLYEALKKYMSKEEGKPKILVNDQECLWIQKEWELLHSKIIPIKKGEAFGKFHSQYTAEYLALFQNELEEDVIIEETDEEDEELLLLGTLESEI